MNARAVTKTIELNGLSYRKCMKYRTTSAPLIGGDPQRDPDIQAAQIDVSDGHRDVGQHQQRDEDGQQDTKRHDVGGACGGRRRRGSQECELCSVPYPLPAEGVRVPSAVSVNEIQQRKQIDPDQVHQVPVESDAVDRAVVLGAEMPLAASARATT